MIHLKTFAPERRDLQVVSQQVSLTVLYRGLQTDNY